MFNIFLLLFIVGNSIISGIFFSFSNSIMKALAKSASSNGRQVMNDINRVIINPVFMLLFLGTPLFAVLLLFLDGFSNLWIILATISHIVGSFGVTITQNVPRNNRLEKANDYWNTYVKEWTFWNHIRTIFAILSTLFAVLYLL